MLPLGSTCDYWQRTTVIGKNGSISGREVKSARVAVADEDSRPTFTFMEVQPLLGLRAMSRCRRTSNWVRLTVGCQCNSRKPFGSSTTNVAAIVVAIGKLVESIL
jgi:hypothetical protein